jgi:hypothetical protein
MFSGLYISSQWQYLLADGAILDLVMLLLFQWNIAL